MPPSPEPFPQTLLARSHPPTVAADLYTERVLKRPLYLRATSPEPSARATRRAALNARKAKSRTKSQAQKPRPLSAAQKRSLGLLDVPASQQRYEVYEGLHGLWCGYMAEILGLGTGGDKKGFITATSAGQQIASADMHGAGVEVVRSRCVGRVGIRGIVVRDTRGTFEVVTKGGRVKRVPKEGGVFRVRVPVPGSEEEGGGEAEGEGEGKEGGEKRKEVVFEILGEQFQSRGVDRANKRFRMHYQKDL